MATVTHAGATWNTTAGNKTVTATPAANDLIVAVQGSTNSAATGHAISDDNSGGAGTYTQINVLATESGNGKRLGMWVRDALIVSGTSTIFTQTVSGNSGGGLSVYRISGMTKTGLTAILQNALQNEQAGSTTPAPVLGATPQSGNPIIGAVVNGTNPATLTPRTGYTEAPTPDLGYATPTAGLEVCFLNSGETSATITWGGTSASVFCSFAIELDASGAGAAGSLIWKRPHPLIGR